MINYPIMKITIFIAGMFLSMFMSCIEYKKAEPQIDAQTECFVVVSFHPGTETKCSTRGMSKMDETTVADVNLYARHTATGVIKHQYIESSMNAGVTLTKGEWELYACANVGHDLGEQVAEDMNTLKFDMPEDGNLEDGMMLPMSGYEKVTITGDAALMLQLVRVVAKIQVSIKVAPAMADRIALQGIQLMNIPSVGFFFEDNHNDSFLDCPPKDLDNDAFTNIFYIPENKAGTVSTITDPQQRTPGKAPQGASYFQITGTCDGKQVYYYVYPGDDVISDFNIRRNQCYVMNITVCGADPADCRVAVHDITLTEINDYYAPTQLASSTLSFTAENNADNKFIISYIPVKGHPKVFIDGDLFPTGIIATSLSGSMIRFIADVGITSEQEEEVAVDFIVTDSYGRQVIKRLETRFIIPEPLGLFIDPCILIQGKTSNLTFHVTEVGYPDPIPVTFNEVSGDGKLIYGATTITTGTVLNFMSGDYTFQYTPAGTTPLLVDMTARDRFGVENHERLTFNVYKSQISISTTITWGAELIGKGTDYLLVGFAEVEVKASTPVPMGVQIDFNVLYEKNHTVTGYKENKNLLCSVYIAKDQRTAEKTIIRLQESEAPLYSNGILIKDGTLLSGIYVTMTSFSAPPPGIGYKMESPNYIKRNKNPS